jgi:hypothetical protein
MSSMLWGSQKKTSDEREEEVGMTSTPKQADINVFTVASGHLYEVSGNSFGE